MNKADVGFIKQAFKNGKVEERGVHLRETSMAVESCQQPPTSANATDASPQGEICPACDGVGVAKGMTVDSEICDACNGSGKLPLAE